MLATACGPPPELPRVENQEEVAKRRHADDMQMNRHMKRCSALLITREMEIKWKSKLQ